MVEPGAARELAESLAGLEVRAGGPHLERCSRDRSPFHRRPLAVAVPADAEEAARAVAAAASLDIPVTARAGGSSVAGQCLGEGLIVDVSRLDSIEPAADRGVWCGPGVVLDALNSELGRRGRAIGPDVTSSRWAMVGGLVATNACGARSLLHGRFGEALQEADVVLADGTPVRLAPGEVPRALADGLAAAADGLDSDLAGWPRQPRSPGGYRLPELARRRDALSVVPGSEGTLCLLVRARLATVEAPRRRRLGVASFRELGDALRAAPEAGQAGASAVELLDRRLVAAARALGLDAIEPGAGAALIVETTGAGAVARPGGAVAWSELEGDRAALAWSVRSRALELVGNGLVPVALFEDPAVSPERAAGFCAALLDLLAGRGMEALVYGHAAAGCLHVRPLCDPREPGLATRLLEVASEVCDLVLAWDGALTGEHGWGLARSHLARRALGDRLYGRCLQVKRAFDPDGVLNPGMIVDGDDPAPLFSPA